VEGEEAGIVSVAAGDWTIAATPIPPNTTDAELVALAARQEPQHHPGLRRRRHDVAAFRRFTGKPRRPTYLSDLQRYADSLVGAPDKQRCGRGVEG
jgi:hypothetical protein